MSYPGKWWPASLPDVFADYPEQVRLKCLGHVEVITQVLLQDGLWGKTEGGTSAYQNARQWGLTGKWDVILACLHESGKTENWPTVSRWGVEPFNSFGFPNTGLFTIVSLRQAFSYRRSVGPAISESRPMQRLFRAAANWRTSETLGDTRGSPDYAQCRPAVRQASILRGGGASE